ncbi:MAG: NAD+ synthase [Alphaproteobacteria bacterium]|nr:NAD+ synthase [Alphaproteobacteria bacterium]
MSANLNITLAQLNPVVGDLEGNAKKIIKIWKENDANSHLVVFPELFLSGYPPEDLILNYGFLCDVEDTIKSLQEKSKNFKSAALIPAPYRKDGKTYNAVYLIDNGTIKHTQSKHLLPTYGVYDEDRIFEAGPLPSPIEFCGLKLGILICRDIWFDNIPAHFGRHKIDLMLSINGSPFDETKMSERLRVCRKATELAKAPLLYLNMIGGQDELAFDGRSFVMNSFGDIIEQAPAFKDHILHIKTSEIQHKAPIKIEEDELKLIYEALKTGLKDYIRKSGFKSVILGLSGGIDSALSAAIAVDALGKENVQCIMLPSKFTSKDSLDDAKKCAKRLGTSYEIIEIKDAVKTFEKIIPDLKDLAHENMQSRTRGLILMALSNARGSMLLTTGNKSEMAVGYATIYGDMNGGWNALKDVYKTDVYRLAKWRNTQSKVIPENILTKAPSAELRKDQTDQDSLPPYDMLDTILQVLVEYAHLDWSQITDEELFAKKDLCDKNPEIVQKIAALLKNSEYKRRQSPPGTKITTCAFTKERRYPIANAYTNTLKEP